MEPGKLKIQLCLLQAQKQRLASGKEQQGKPQTDPHGNQSKSQCFPNQISSQQPYRSAQRIQILPFRKPAFRRIPYGNEQNQRSQKNTDQTQGNHHRLQQRICFIRIRIGVIIRVLPVAPCPEHLFIRIHGEAVHILPDTRPLRPAFHQQRVMRSCVIKTPGSSMLVLIHHPAE